jgi:hypothetical protein
MILQEGGPARAPVAWLTQIRGAVHVDDRTGHARRCVERAVAHDLGHFLGRGDAPERLIGEHGGIGLDGIPSRG